MPDAEPSPASLLRTAWAKLNLALAVDRPFPDDHPRGGFHPIASWMVAIDLVDTVRFERLGPGDSPVLSRRWATGDVTPWCDPEDDLCFRSLRALERAAGRPLPVRIELEKRIPVGGGLGGGSSDAATTLRGVVDLFGLDIAGDELLEIAVSIGSDIPFFLDLNRPATEPPRAAVVSGVGERVVRLDRHPAAGWEVAVLTPPFGCPTPAVYRSFDAALAPGGSLGGHVFRGERVEELARSSPFNPAALFNDLTLPACLVEPALGEVLESVRQRFGVAAHVSGSGSTVFAFGLGDTSEADLPAPRCNAESTGSVRILGEPS